MVTVNTAYSNAAYYSAASSQSAAATSSRASGQATASGTTQSAATTVTLSEEAIAAMSERSFAAVLSDARSKLDTLLAEAGRTSPLESGALALDFAKLDARELFAMASDQSFTSDEQAAGGLEMQRRFEAAMAGPAAVAKVTGSFTGLYKAAAEYLESLGPEEKADADWIAGRAAVTEGLKQLQSNPRTLPNTSDADPVTLYLAIVESGQPAGQQTSVDLATSARRSLDALYAAALKTGKAPTFNRQTAVGTFIDISGFESRTLSAMVLDASGRFSETEVGAAKKALDGKSGAALLAGFQSASKSGDPTAFSQNIISIYGSMSADERQAAGWTSAIYETALQSYQSTSKLLQMFSDAGVSSGGFMSWLGK